MYLEDCISVIKEYFPDKWENEFLFSSPEEIEESQSNLLSKITIVTNKVFEKLHLSVLGGEYLIEENFEDYINSFNSVLEGSTVDPGSVVDESYNQFVNTFLRGFIFPLRVAIKNYDGHFRRIKRRYETPERLSLFEAVSVKEFFIPNNIPISSVNDSLSDFININLHLSLVDHNIAVKSNQLKDMILIYHTLDDRVKASNDKVLYLLKDKCGFLIKKILIKYDKDPRNYYYALDFDDKPFSISQFEVGYFSEYNNLVQVGYAERDKNEDEYSELKSSIYRIDKDVRNENVILFEDYFKYIKYYKENDHQSCNKIERLISNFKKQEDSLNGLNSLLNKWAYQVSLNYLINNQISFEINNKSITLENFMSKISNIDILQEETGIKNYFPYLKIFQYIMTLFDTKLDKLQTNSDLQEIQNEAAFINRNIEELEKIEKQLYLSFEWCSDRNFIPFQVPQNECIKKIELGEGESLNLFLASTFILPINFEKVKLERDNASRNLMNLKSRLYSYNTLKSEKEQVIRIKAEVEKTDRRQIEILSIFAAIVLFVSSNIQVFAKAESFTDALRFMLLFAYVLVLFIVSIWLISRDNGFKFSIKNISAIHWFFMLLLTLATIIALVLIYPDFKSELKAKRQEKSLSIEIERH
ncbi:MAG TPA: hypothetical protein DER09_12755 [Prolixibacteraceae bacterium]|nr:hypothetical protein [Prolixibacteraceae bacterium]